LAITAERQREKYHLRKAEGRAILGDKCAHCGYDAVPEILEFDHIDPLEKTLELTEQWSCSRVRWLAEIDKCQLLCPNCHAIKTLRNRDYLARRLAMKAA
jgi:5-methylcytosine-specific restriction endonuclease McrA